MVITAGDKPLLIVKFSKSPACGNVTSAPLVAVTLSERITIEAGRKVWHSIYVYTRNNPSGKRSLIQID